MSLKDQREPGRVHTGVLKLGLLDAGQVSAILVFLLATKVFLTLPSDITLKVGTAAWISIALAAALAFAGLWGWVRWSKFTGNLGFVPSLRLCLGKVLGNLVALIIIFYFLFITAFSVRVFAGGAVLGLLPEFPIEILIVIVIISAIYAAWLGLEAVARASAFFYPIIILSLVFVGLGSFRLFDIRHLYPIFGLGIPAITRGGLDQVGIFGGVPVIAVLKSYLRYPDRLAKTAYRGLVMATVFMMASIFMILATLPYPEGTRHLIPLGVIARAVHLGRFLQRIEALFTFTWFFASAIHASICYMMSLILLSQLMNTRTYRPLVPGVGLLTFGIAALPNSFLAAGRALSSVYFYLGTTNVALGLALYVIALIGHAQKKTPER